MTLSTVTIFERTETEINGRPAVVYDIEKKPGVVNFPHQPKWRNERHNVTDIRSTDSNPTIFYVFGQRPKLDQVMIDKILGSVEFFDEQNSSIIAPINEFSERITKKPFGIYVTPENSPVKTERFRGFHTAVDVEYGDVAEDVAVFAVADGQVMRSGYVGGYGGMIAISHTINGQEYVAIYGHLAPQSLVANGTQVKQGQQIGILGKGGTAETDGERKHLHFGLHIGSDVNVKGYVQTKAELSGWADPQTIIVQ
ncbi:MAG: hypothetical protein COT81_04925 [Candidatus Buchananbacteria bacterium CG10_big_fil_rev_8_21_14_0_10_42_9]|uniref:M23ase beta-sheet core domain-containing protein n=1 Tax=Candidatus Buchananbacteria bacterium CG10_big_fil_rev_8_21_14_0_10_42_9 TaxID=1974526 RepID=A0A2H0W059_9BACT|nr:MAG: hypothetical protein COT81_04925 [Candidatus Buchananbacteria bacterium CG10_big_fil_rev_8_21_14_0_10_42_9]